MKMRIFIPNEGFAEVLRYCSLGQAQHLNHRLYRSGDLQKPVTFQWLDLALDNLDCADRMAAFDAATAFVWSMVRECGLRRFFTQLSEIGARYDPDDLCLIASILP